MPYLGRTAAAPGAEHDSSNSGPNRWLLAAIVESSEDAIISKDLNGTVTTWNRAAERIFGYSADEMLGRPISILLPRERSSEEAEFIERIRQGERIAGHETVRIRKDGIPVHVHLTISPVRDSTGRIIGASKIARDLTEQKRTETALARSEEQARLIADATPALISYIDSDLRYRFVNREYELWFNRTRQSVVGKHMAEVLGEVVLERLRPHITAVLAGQEVHFETEAPYLEGGHRWIEAHYVPDREGNKIVGFYVLVLDVTTRRKAEEELRASESRYRELAEAAAVDRGKLAAVIENMAQPVMIAEADGRFIFMNRASLQLHGVHSVEELKPGVGRLADRFELADAAGRVLPLEKWPLSRAALGERIDEELQVFDRQTGRRWIGVYTGGPVRNSAGEIVLIVLTMHDITERKRMEQALRESRDDLERIVSERTAKLQEIIAELETFSYSIAHDMRAPLRAMQGFAEAVLEDYGDRVGDEGRNYLERIKVAAARQDHFIRDVLSYSRLVRQDLQLDSVDLDDLVQGVLAEYPDLHAFQDCIEIRPPLGRVVGHAPSLVQCLSNLLGNAVKFVPAGTRPRVRVWTERRDEVIRLIVEDNGLGIALEHQKRIFGLFERLHPQTQFPGTGIGLAVVRKAVERMGGEVGVESQLEKGSRFWIELKARPGPGYLPE